VLCTTRSAGSSSELRRELRCRDASSVVRLCVLRFSRQQITTLGAFGFEADIDQLCQLAHAVQTDLDDLGELAGITTP